MLQELQLPCQQSLGLIYYPYCWTTLHPQNLPHPGTVIHVSVISNVKLTPNPLHDPRPWFHYMSIHIHALEEKHHLSHYAFSLSSTSWAYFKDAWDRRSGLTGPHQPSESTNLQLWFSLSPALCTTWKVSKRHAEIYGKLNDAQVYLSGQDYRDLRNSSTFSFCKY